MITTNDVLYLPVFQNDFIPLKKGLRCAENKNDVIKEFPFPADGIDSSQIALKICETFCSTERRCWGCSIHCNISCEYSAVSSCKVDKEIKGPQDGEVTQKPGTKNI